MRFRFDPESRTQKRAGRAAVTGLLVLIYLTTFGCADSEDAKRERVSQDIRSTPYVDATPTVTPASMVADVERETTPERVIPERVSFAEAETLFAEGHYEEAVDFFEVYVRDNPENTWGHYMLGLSAKKAGRYDDAERAFADVLERDPHHVKTLLNLSRVFLETGRYEEALERIELAIDIDPVTAGGYRLQGLAYYGIGSVDDALDSFREAILVNEEDAWSMNNLALVLIRLDRFVEALPPLARATQLRDDVAVFQNNLGIALERMGHLGDAARAYEAALAIDADYDKARSSLARVSELEEGVGIGPVDLAALAAQFVEEIASWREPAVAPPQLEVVPTDTLNEGVPQDTAASERDSITAKVDTSAAKSSPIIPPA